MKRTPIAEEKRKEDRKYKKPLSEVPAIEEMVLQRLEEIKPAIPIKQEIDFPTVFSRICPIFCITKKQAWLILKKLQGKGKIKIIPFQGIRVMPPGNQNVRRVK
ncbi:MAG: hypothetical protein QME51_08505 [Planctomycetota bacterium]|nr:hypothetical protein [Planctomycetota bacterium]